VKGFLLLRFESLLVKVLKEVGFLPIFSYWSQASEVVDLEVKLDLITKKCCYILLLIFKYFVGGTSFLRLTGAKQQEKKLSLRGY